jgi:NAD-dependent dihydropyrimidine dehydrogenase PreA subunit
MPPKVDADKCTGCGTCYDVCPADPVVFSEPDPDNENYKSKVLNPDDCQECFACVENCPEEAITFED